MSFFELAILLYLTYLWLTSHEQNEFSAAYYFDILFKLAILFTFTGAAFDTAKLLKKMFL